MELFKPDYIDIAELRSLIKISTSLELFILKNYGKNYMQEVQKIKAKDTELTTYEKNLIDLVNAFIKLKAVEDDIHRCFRVEKEKKELKRKR